MISGHTLQGPLGGGLNPFKSWCPLDKLPNIADIVEGS